MCVRFQYFYGSNQKLIRRGHGAPRRPPRAAGLAAPARSRLGDRSHTSVLPHRPALTTEIPGLAPAHAHRSSRPDVRLQERLLGHGVRHIEGDIQGAWCHGTRPAASRQHHACRTGSLVGGCRQRVRLPVAPTAGVGTFDPVHSCRAGGHCGHPMSPPGSTGLRARSAHAYRSSERGSACVVRDD
jgi:hypothetical protein